MIQPVLKNFTVSETAIQAVHFLVCNILDTFAPWPRKIVDQVDLPSSTRYVDGWLRYSRYTRTSMHYINDWRRTIVAVNSPMRVDARSHMNVFGTSHSKYYRRQSLWDEWRRFSHCPPIGALSCSKRGQVCSKRRSPLSLQHVEQLICQVSEALVAKLYALFCIQGLTTRNAHKL